jgi:hypothetical protein
VTSVVVQKGLVGAFVAVLGIAVLLVSVVYWTSQWRASSAAEQRAAARTLVETMTGVEIRRACVGVEGDGVRFFIAESAPMSSAEIAAYQLRLSNGARVACNQPVLGPGGPMGEGVPWWFDWDPSATYFLDRCVYSRINERTELLMRSDHTLLVAHREDSIERGLWPSDTDLASMWSDCR